MSYFLAKISENGCFKFYQTYLQLNNKPLFTNTIGNLFLFSLSVFKRGITFMFQAGYKTSQLALKSEHLFTKLLCSKTFTLLFFLCVMLFKDDLTTS